MRRRLPSRIAVWGASLLFAAVPTAPAARAQAAPGPLLARAFTITAEAFPAEPAPGANQTTLGIRPVATRAGATNPPAAAFARASATDFGLIEAYTGPQGPSAEADTASENGRPDHHVEEGGMTLDAHASRAPRGNATASANNVEGDVYTAGSSQSASTVDGGGGKLTAVAMAEMNDVASGPMLIGSARFDAAVELDGTPGGAKASGRVTATDATVSGVPVVIDDHGLRVNEAAVPTEQISAVTEAVRMGLNRGGYIDVRVVQPIIEVAPDGLRASVRGGGVRIRMSTNDPTNNYFLEFNLVAGSASALLGPFIGEPAPVPQDFAGSTGGGDFPSVFTPARPVERIASPLTPAPTTPPAATRVEPPLPLTVEADEAASYRLASRWPWWPWLVAALALVALFAASLHSAPMAPALRRVSAFSDRYLRG